MARQGVNKVILVGNLGKDPELKYFASGDAYCNVTVATSESWKDKEGNDQERTEWHNVVLTKHGAEFVGTYLKKGAKIYVEGSLRTRKWQDSDGNDRYTTEINAFEVQSLDKRDSQGQQSQGSSANTEDDDFDF